MTVVLGAVALLLTLAGFVAWLLLDNAPEDLGRVSEGWRRRDRENKGQL